MLILNMIMFKIYFVDKTPLYYAVMKNNIEIVKLLLANPNIKVSFYSIFKCYIF